MVPFPRVEVTWLDSHSEEGWVEVPLAISRAEDKNAIRVYNTGFLIAETDEYLLLAAGISPGVDKDDDLVIQTMQIPLGAVVGLVTLAQG